MKTLHAVLLSSIVAVSAQPALSEETESSKATAAGAGASTTEEFDKQFATLQEQMTRMQDEMNRIRQTQDPKERERLLQQHWKSMQDAMSTMHGMWGGRMGPGMMGPGMMGGRDMMWNDYRNLTPEQLKHRQYMMDRWLPMHQMMMEQMMQHHQWMMPPPSPAPEKKD